MLKINNTMVQENRQEIWCAFCKNENTEQCKNCVFAGMPTRYKGNEPIIEAFNIVKEQTGEKGIIENERWENFNAI